MSPWGDTQLECYLYDVTYGERNLGHRFFSFYDRKNPMKYDAILAIAGVTHPAHEK